MLVRELVDGQEIDQVLLVRDRRHGGDRSLLKLGDRTGCLRATAEPEAAARCEPGSVVHVTGRYAGGELEIRAVRAATDAEYDLAELLDGPPRSATGMESDLRELLATVQDPHLRALLDAVFGPGSPTWRQFRDAPAAKRYHQAYRHGLLEHSLTVAQAVSAISATFPGIDRDVAVTGALLHDIGKLEAYTADPLAIDMTDARQAPGRDPARLLPDPPADRGAAGLPGAARRGRAAHHPQPPRHARARLAGRAVHARGHARAHDRQPRRPPRLLRPAREGARPTAPAGRRSTGRCPGRPGSPAPRRRGALTSTALVGKQDGVGSRGASRPRGVSREHATRIPKRRHEIRSTRRAVGARHEDHRTATRDSIHETCRRSTPGGRQPWRSRSPPLRAPLT